jgi:hypothetical protein
MPPHSWAAVVRSADGSDPAPGAGSVIANAERTRPRASGARYRPRCEADATWSSRWTFPSSGAAMFSASGPNREYPASSKTGARLVMFKPAPP